MIAETLITFRETLEASLVIGAVLAYLVKSNQLIFRKFVWSGVSLGVLFSILIAAILTKFLGGLEGRFEEIFEGSLMLIAAALLTTVILWMIGGEKKMMQKIKEKVNQETTKKHFIGILLLAFFAVLREGVETVIFLGAVSKSEPISIFGSLLGILIALIVGWLFFWGVLKLNVKHFMIVTNIILILLAAGLVSGGIHELQEAGILPLFIEHVWSTNWLISQESTAGKILGSLFGYRAEPSLLELLGWALYMGLVSGAYINILRSKKVI